MVDPQTFGERVAALRKAKGLSQDDVAKVLKATKSSISGIERGRNYPLPDRLVQMAQLFGVSVDYLLTGQESIQKSHTPAPPERAPSLLSDADYVEELQQRVRNLEYELELAGGAPALGNTVHYIGRGTAAADIVAPVGEAMLKRSTGHVSGHRGKQPAPQVSGSVLVVTVDRDNNENIVMVSTQAEASYPTRYLEPEYFHDLPAFSIPLPQFRNATFRAFQVTGASMVPTFHPGGWVIGRYVDWRVESIQEGYVHVVVTREAVVVKRVLDRITQRGTLALQSDNEEYQTFEVRIEDVLEIWRVGADIGFNFPNTRFELVRKVASMEADMRYMMQQMQEVKNQLPATAE